MKYTDSQYFSQKSLKLMNFDRVTPIKMFQNRWFWLIFNCCSFKSPMAKLGRSKMSQDVYREPRPMHIDAVMRRVREASLKLTAETMTKMRQAFPAKWNEVYRLKGKKIPSTFDPRKSKYAWKCKICMKWVKSEKIERGYPIEIHQFERFLRKILRISVFH